MKNRNRFVLLSMIVSLLLGLLTGVSSAESYGVWIGGTEINDENYQDVFGDQTVSYAPGSKTLTLNGYTYSGSGYEKCALYAADDLNIVVQGTNSLTSEDAGGFGIYAAKTVTVTGDGENSVLNVTAANTGYSIKVAGSSADFSNVSMALSGNRGIVVNENNDSDTIRINNCSMSFAEGMDRSMQAWNGTGDAAVFIENSTLTGYGRQIIKTEGESGDAVCSVKDSSVTLSGTYGLQVESAHGDSSAVIDNSEVSISASTSANGAINLGAGSEMGKTASVDIRNNSEVTLSGALAGLNVWTWGSKGVEMSTKVNVSDSTLNVSGYYYGISAYAYAKGKTDVLFENSEINAEGANWAGISLGAGESYNKEVIYVNLESVDSKIITSGPYGMDVCTETTSGTDNPDASATVTISGGSFECTGLINIYGDHDEDGNGNAVITFDDTEAIVDITSADPGDMAISADELNIAAGKFVFLYDEDAQILADEEAANITGGVYKEQFDTDLLPALKSFVPNTGSDSDEYPWMIGNLVITLKANYVDADPEEETQEFTEPADLITPFSRDGFVLTGWNTESNGSGEPYDLAENISDLRGSLTLFAQWKAAAASVTVGEGAEAVTTNFTEFQDALDYALNAVPDDAAVTVQLFQDVSLTDPIEIEKPLSVDLNGHEISGEDESLDNIFVVGPEGDLTMEDSSDDRSGKITGAGESAVKITDDGKFTMTGGSISENGGNGVDVISGIFMMTGGSISENDGNGVNVESGLFLMTDGEISQNGESGVNAEGGTFTMTGGEISENSGGGVNVGEDAAFNISGSPKVTDNTKDGETGNVYLPDGQTINVTDKLGSDASLGITTETGKTGVFAQGNGKLTADDMSKFSDDTGTYSAVLKDGDAYLLNGDYYCESGEGQVHTKMSDEDAPFTVKNRSDDTETFVKFTDIKVDNAPVDEGNYTAVEGSVIVTLKADYLNMLAAGKHTLTVNFDDGFCDTWFVVRNKPHNGPDLLSLLQELPRTGFSAVRSSVLPVQPKDLNYKPVGRTLEIPSMSVQAEIVEVPYTDGEYPITWLDQSVGMLEGSALPGRGCTYLTGHNHLSSTEAGPFAMLKWIQIGDRIYVRDRNGWLQTFTVYANVSINAGDIAALERVASEKENTLILITCEDEQVNGNYSHRRIIAAAEQ